ncbi:DUF7344 domain-containing protein [Haladaptatus pallidirubidus]|uniref:DUF7344 domain-containing protein n=1 Tax=Haladaptatus pallidirubidus TaxID=1008152 RepID=UPI001D102F4E|nr:hypothetical protein [Haladaptatus pallidirubidus]
MSNESPYRDDSGKRPSTDPPHVLRAEPAVSRPSFDDIFKLLSEKRRRYAIHHLSATPEGVATLSDLVEQVAAWETETSTGDVPDDYQRRVEASLHHTHTCRNSMTRTSSTTMRGANPSATGDNPSSKSTRNTSPQWNCQNGSRLSRSVPHRPQRRF